MSESDNIARQAHANEDDSLEPNREEEGVDSLLAETRALSEDVLEWLRLRVHLIQLEVHERLNEEINAILTSVLVLGILLIALLLFAMGLGALIGELIGSIAAGFGIVALLLVVLGVVLGRTQPKWIGDALFMLAPRRWLSKEKTENGKHDSVGTE